MNIKIAKNESFCFSKVTKKKRIILADLVKTIKLCIVCKANGIC